MGKPFSANLYERYDRAGKNAMFDYLTDLGWEVQENPDQYGIDLLCTSATRSIEIEVEVKVYWQDRFPFKTLHIPFRKAKFANDNSVFAILSGDLTRAALVSGRDLKGCTVIEKLTSETGDKQDKFFEVPLKLIEFVAIENPGPHKGETGPGY